MVADTYQRAHKSCSKVIMLKLRKEFREYFIYKIYTELLNYLVREKLYVCGGYLSKSSLKCSNLIKLGLMKGVDNSIFTKYTQRC
jgi:hypothetical protein